MNTISKELEAQKKVSNELQQRLTILESKNSREGKSSTEYKKPQHRKANSDAYKHLELLKLKLQTKSGLEDYLTKRTQHKIKLNTKKKISSDVISYEGSGSTQQLPFVATDLFTTKLKVKDEAQGSFDKNEEAVVLHEPLSFVETKKVETKHKHGDVTALYVKDSDNESELSLNENDLPQHIPRFMNSETKAMMNETLGTLYKASESLPKHSECLFHEKSILQSHMDSVRDVQFSCNLNYLVTVSEDCMVKLWDIKGFKKNTFPHPTRIEPCFSYRGHTGPLFSVCVGSGLQQNSHFFYTAGSEGIIRIWGIPSVDNSKFPNTNGKNFCVGLWTSHRDVIWQLVHHPHENLLLSVSADGTVKMWKEFDISEMVDGIDKSIFHSLYRFQ